MKRTATIMVTLGFALLAGVLPALIPGALQVLGNRVVLLGVTDAQAQSWGGAACLQITPGARADGMGRAAVSVANDATANWWNPAMLALQQDRIVSLMHTQLVPDLADDVYYENLGYAMHLPGWGGVGFSLIYLTYGKSVYVDEKGWEGGEFSSYEVSPQASIGTELMPGVAAGLTLKYVYIMLAPAWATGGLGKGDGDSFGADLGLLIRSTALIPSYQLNPTFPMTFNLGINVQNLGPDISFISHDQADPMPKNLKIGIGVNMLRTNAFNMIASYDYNKTLVYSDEKPIHNVGGELSFRDFFALRAGYIYDKQGDIIDPTFGLGVTVPLSTSKVSFDYASVPQAQVLDRVSKFSVSFRF
jgi:hypothetical protein